GEIQPKATDATTIADVAPNGTFVLPQPPAQPTKPSSPARISPDPVIRFAGRLTRTGAYIRVLQVKAPNRSTLSVRCVGRDCPFRHRTMKVGGRSISSTVVRVRIPALQRAFRAGTVIELAITQQGKIGKFTRI